LGMFDPHSPERRIEPIKPQRFRRVPSPARMQEGVASAPYQRDGTTVRVRPLCEDVRDASVLKLLGQHIAWRDRLLEKVRHVVPEFEIERGLQPDVRANASGVAEREG